MFLKYTFKGNVRLTFFLMSKLSNCLFFDYFYMTFDRVHLLFRIRIRIHNLKLRIRIRILKKVSDRSHCAAASDLATSGQQIIGAVWWRTHNVKLPVRIIDF
jgi:hypothetical protein